MSNTPLTNDQKLAAWASKVPEHVRPMASRFTFREVALDAGTLMMRKAVDTETRAQWGRVNLHADGSFECYRVTDPPDAATPLFKSGPCYLREAAEAEGLTNVFVETIVALEPSPPPTPGKTWGDRKRRGG